MRTEQVPRRTGLEPVYSGFSASLPPITKITDIIGVFFATYGERLEAYAAGMAEKNDLSDQMEIKVEPTMQCYVDDENDFNGFEGSSAFTPSSADVMNMWTSKATSCLITRYKKYRSMVGQSTQIRSLREMFEMISLEMQKFGFYFSPQKCENKWRVLERKYKNLVYRERLKKPGRMRHYGHWEHKRALDEIFDEKKRHVYLEDRDIPPPAPSLGSAAIPSTKYALILPKPSGDQGANRVQNGQTTEDPLASTSSVESQNKKIAQEMEAKASSSSSLVSMLDRYLANMEKNFAAAQASKERRHKEKMAIRQSELEVQKKMLKLKEQKMELDKSKLLAAAQHLHLNMQ